MSIFHRWIKQTFRGTKPLRQLPKRKTKLNLEILEDRVVPSSPVSPYVVSIDLANPASAKTNASSVSWNVTFNEAVTGVNPTDFTVVKGGTVGETLVQVAPVTASSGAEYTVTVSGITGNGTLGLNLFNNGSIVSAVGALPLDPLSFATPATYGIGPSYSQTGLITADLRGDGISDIVIPEFSYHSVGVLLGNGDGTFKPEVNWAAGDQVLDVAAGVLTSNGFVDLVLTTQNKNAVEVLMGNGDGTFKAPVSYAIQGKSYGITIGDVSGDGFNDIVVTTKSHSDVGVLINNGDGTFKTEATYGTAGDPMGVQLADLSGDGHLDIVATSYNQGAVYVLKNNGDGTFAPSVSIPTFTGYSYSVAVGDVNGDGKPDIVQVLEGQPDKGTPGSVVVLLGNGNGTFQAPASYALATPALTDNYATTVDIADMNGDGTPDLVVGYGYYGKTNGHNVAVLLGNGDGSFQAPQTFSIGSGYQPWAAVGQVNGDGVPFIATRNGGSYSSSVLVDTSVGFNGDPTGQVATIDTLAPHVVSINRAVPPAAITDASSVQFTVTFSEAVTGVDPTDFSVTKTGVGENLGYTLMQVTGSGATYTVTVSGITGNGTLGLNLIDNSSIRDLAGNPLATPGAAASFNPQTTVASGGSANQAIETDINGDGNTDLVVANYSADNVSVLLGNGNGTFQTHHTFAVGSAPENVVAADLNGDGKPDLVVANFNYGQVGTGTISVLLNTTPTDSSTPSFTSQVTYAIPGGAHSVAVADVNGDGIPDIVVTGGFGSTTLSVLLGNGDGTFQAPLIFADQGGYRVAVADLNGDGKPDLVVANYDGGNVGVLMGTGGTGEAMFSSELTFATGTSPYGVAVADLNGDKIPDLVVSNRYNSTVSVLLGTGGTGEAMFSGQQTYTVGTGALNIHGHPGDRPTGVVVADLNGDGIPDIAVANFGDATVSVLQGNGDGTFQAQTTMSVGDGPLSVATGDLTGDGRPDLAVANYYAGTVSLLLNSGSGSFTTGQSYTIDTIDPTVVSINRADTNPATGPSVDFTVTFSEPVTGVTAADFAPQPSVGVTDTGVSNVTGTGTTYTVTVGGISGTGTLGLNLVDDTTAENTIHDLAGNSLAQATPTPYPLSIGGQNNTAITGFHPYSIAEGDLGNGQLDMVIGDFSNFGTAGGVEVLLGNGNGDFHAAPTIAFPNGGVDSVTLADLTGDGKLDLIVGLGAFDPMSITATPGVVVFMGNGDGTFQAPQTVLSGIYANAVAAADVNGDGKVDLIVANKGGNAYNGTSVSVLLGNGDGTFQAPHTFATGTDPDSLVVADLTGNGKPDIIVGNGGSANVSVLLGNGDGTFLTTTVATTAPYPINSVAVSDLNGDGKPDIVVGYGTYSSSTGAVGVLLGNGNGTFHTSVTYAVGDAAEVAVGDLNGDGKPDIVVANYYYAGNVSVLLGNGNGTFQAQQKVPIASNLIPAMVLGDVNNDGRADIVLADYNKHPSDLSVLLNTANGDFTGQTYNIAAPSTPVALNTVVVNANTYNIVNAVVASGVVTITTAEANPFVMNESVAISQIGSGYDGVYTITGVSGNTFTYTDGSATGTVTDAGTATISQTSQIASATVLNGVVTITTTAPNTFTTNETVVIGGVGSGYDGTYTITGVSGNTFTYADGSATGTVNNSGTVVGDTGPLVGAQRSMVDSITYAFNQAVNLTASAFSIVVHAGETGTAPTLSVWSPDGGATWIVTFSGAGVVANSIANGAYDIAVDLTQVTAVVGGAAGSGSRTDSFFRLYGDINGDGFVNGGDNLKFKTALNTYNAAFDVNDDGFVNGGDNLKFKAALTGINFGGFTQTI